MVSVPSGYQTLIQEMSAGTGIPESIEEAQANVESGFNPTAVSPAGAEGWLQFLPSTYNAYASQAGVPPGSEFNPADETKVYIVFMNSLLRQEGGNIQKALAAYNAGAGDLGAGMGYANEILGAAGMPASTTAGQAQTTSALGGLGSLLGGNLSISGILGNVVGDMRDLMERLGLILLGAALLLLGIHLLSGGSSGVPAGGGGGGEETTVKVEGAKPPKETKEATGLAKGTGTSEAVEAAAAA